MIMSLLVNSEKYYNLPHYCHIMYDNNGTPPFITVTDFHQHRGRNYTKAWVCPPTVEIAMVYMH